MRNKFFNIITLLVITLFVLCYRGYTTIIDKKNKEENSRILSVTLNDAEEKELIPEHEEVNPKPIFSPTTPTTNENEIIIGIEYAFPGTGNIFAEIRYWY